VRKMKHVTPQKSIFSDMFARNFNAHFLLALILVQVIPAEAASGKGTHTISLHATVTYSTINTPNRGFAKFLYSFPLPAGNVQWVGLSGTSSLKLVEGRYSEALISVNYLPSGTPCPIDGSQFSSYEGIGTAYPALRGLQSFILKQPSVGTNTLSLAKEKLPVPVPITGSCLVLVVDAGPALGPALVTVTSNLFLRYIQATAPTRAPYILGGGSEFCFGQKGGCQAHTTTVGASFSDADQVSQDGQLWALVGDISDSTFDGLAPFGPVPSGAWGMSTDFYLLAGGCGAFPLGVSQAGNFHSLLPTNAALLLHVSLQGNGEGDLQTPVFKTFSNLIVHKGDCIVNLVEMTGSPGAIDAENQVKYILQP
jgi:hypothetical protein